MHPGTCDWPTEIATSDVGIEEAPSCCSDQHKVKLENYLAAIARAWPERPQEALAVAECETNSGRHPATFSLDAVHGGLMQLAKKIWAPYFEARYGWSWERIVRDPETHALASREVYDRGGGWDGPWRGCRP